MDFDFKYDSKISNSYVLLVPNINLYKAVGASMSFKDLRILICEGPPHLNSLGQK